jgi:hypothetical protein
MIPKDRWLGGEGVGGVQLYHLVSNLRVIMAKLIRDAPFNPVFPPNTAPHCASDQFLW